MATPTVPSSRLQAMRLLAAVLEDARTLDEALSAHPPAGSPEDARFIRLLVLTALRHLGQLDAVLTEYLAHPIAPEHQPVQHALRIGVAQLLLLGTAPHAAVHSTVEAVKATSHAGHAGLVNAVLQRCVRERPDLPSAIHNLPARFKKRWGAGRTREELLSLTQLAAERPPLDLVLPSPLAQLEGARLDAHVWRLPPDHAPVTELEGFAEGQFWVQDVAATYPVRMLGHLAGKTVLDLGAAPGGKTMQLAKAGAIVTALDQSDARMARLGENLARTQLTATRVVADMRQWAPEAPFDIVLLDAPCSATGTWRRHPEVLHLTHGKDITALATQQRAMLRRAWEWVKPNGVLLYCVCSMEPEEGEDQLRWFMKHHADAALLPSAPEAEIPAACLTPQGALRTQPTVLAEQGGMDGFFAVMWRKSA